MSEYTSVVHWSRGEQSFTDGRYSRRHEIHFDGGINVAGSSSPNVVLPPNSDPSAVDPEEMFVASLSSCHMLWFLDLASHDGWVVDDYRDHAIGVMSRNELGRLAITHVTLNPKVKFARGRHPDRSELDRMHRAAHNECFIANSVKTKVWCEPIE